MTAQEIIDSVIEELKTQGADKIRKRRETIANLADVREGWSGIDWNLKSRPDAVFTMDEGRMAGARRRLKLKLLVRGHHVADLAFARDGAPPKLTCLRTIAKHGISMPERALEWSHNRSDATAIRKFVESCVEQLPEAQHELQVQLQLVARLRQSKASHPELKNLQPVMPFGFPTELATVVDRRGKTSTGNMDILARTVEGRRSDGGTYVVLELKKPNLEPPEVPHAFRQAIGYATALTYEANDVHNGHSPDAAVAYRRFFAPMAHSARARPNYAGKPLRSHAVVVLPRSRRIDAQRELERLLAGDQKPRIGTEEMSIGVLLYSAQFDENVRSGSSRRRSSGWTLRVHGGHERSPRKRSEPANPPRRVRRSTAMIAACVRGSSAFPGTRMDCAR